MLALEGQSLKYSREHVGYLHFVLLCRARLFDKLLQVMLFLITGVIFIFVRLRQRKAVNLCQRDVLLYLA